MILRYICFNSIYVYLCTHCLYFVLNTQETSHFYWQWFHTWKNKWKLKHKRENEFPQALPDNWPGWKGSWDFIISYLFVSIFIYFLKYESIVIRNGLSLGRSEQDTSSVQSLACPARGQRTWNICLW